jgi:hypothetical protein
VGLGPLVEIEGAEQVAVVGDGHRLHPALEHLREQVIEPNRAVEEAILRVQMQVRELGHGETCPSSLAFAAGAIQRKRINRLSTAARAAAAAALLCGGCAGDGAGSVTGTDQVLMAVQPTVAFRPGQIGNVPFVLTSGGVPVAGQQVSFMLADNIAGVTLASPDALTDVNGIATAMIHASVEAMFMLEATAGAAAAEAHVVVGTVGDVVVAPFFAASSTSAPQTTTIDIRFFDGTTCEKIPITNPPPAATGRQIQLSATGGTWTFIDVATDQTSAVVGRALDRNGAPVAAGCVDLPGSALLADGTVQVALPLYDTGPDPVGTFSATSWLVFSPPLAAASAIAAPWRDLADCPLDPAQLWLDCTIDALSSATADDPLDCVPSDAPGGEGPVGDALLARRGALIANRDGTTTSCRGARDGAGAVSIDARVLGLFGSPLPQRIVMLPAVADDAAHILDQVILSSTLDVSPGDRPDRFIVTHTLTSATFSGDATNPLVLGPPMTKNVPLQPLGLPVLTAQATATTQGGQIVIGSHGFTLRLGTVTRAAFGLVALGPRGLPPDPADVPLALAGLAQADDGSTDCPALDRTLCPLIGEGPGCLLAACQDGLAALGGQLAASFDPADGPGLDLLLAGSAALLDATGSGTAHQLGSSVGGQPKVAAWSVDLRTRLGRTALTAGWAAARN